MKRKFKETTFFEENKNQNEKLKRVNKNNDVI